VIAGAVEVDHRARTAVVFSSFTGARRRWQRVACLSAGDKMTIVDRRVLRLQVADDLLQVVGQTEQYVIAAVASTLGDRVTLGNGLFGQRLRT